MGYCTWFTGNVKLDKALAPHHFAYLQAFHTAEHFHWDVDLVKNDPDPIREAVGLPPGENGCYFTGPRAQLDRFFDPPGEPIPYDYSYPPLIHNGGAETDPAYLGSLCPGKPDHHCGWEPGDDGTALVAAVDTFYGYIEWLHYLLDHFLVPWGYVLSGKMSWQGEDENDVGTILVENNVITILKINTLNEPVS